MVVPFVRLYFERSTGKSVIDQGPGTPRIETIHIHMEGTFNTAHGPQEVRPRFWFVALNAVVQVLGDTAYVSTMDE